jgi:ferric-dicitrate binding protein FerR (iron transport regulator)
MKPCDVLERYCDGDLDERFIRVFEDHLRVCTSCANAVDEWRHAAESLSRFVMDEEAEIRATDPRGGNALVRAARERTSTRQRRARSWRLVFAAAATAATVVVLSLFLMDRTVGLTEGLTSPDTTARPAATSSKRVLCVERIRTGSQASFPSPVGLEFPIATGADEIARFGFGGNRIALGSKSLAAIEEIDIRETRIALEQGVLACSIERDAQRAPFLVVAGGTTVRVTGTLFEVKRTSDDSVSVAVARGSVEVRRDGDPRRWSVRAEDRLTLGPVGDPTRNPDERASLRIARLLGDEPEKTSTTLATQQSGTATSKENPGNKKTGEGEEAARIGGGRVRHGVEELSLDDIRDLVIEGDLEAARRHLKRHLNATPADGAAWSLLADCLRKQGDWTGAVGAYEKLVALSPASAANRGRYRGAVLLQDQLDRPDEAARWFEAYLAHGGGSPTLRIRARLRLSRALIRLGRRAEARQNLRRVLESTTEPGNRAQARALLDSLTAVP